MSARAGRHLFLDEGRARLVARACIRLIEELPPEAEDAAQALAEVVVELGGAPPGARVERGQGGVSETPIVDGFVAVMNMFFREGR